MTALAEYLASSNVTDAALAERVGCDRSMINKIKAGKAVPSLTLALAINRETGVSLESFVVAENPTGKPNDGGRAAEASPCSPPPGQGEAAFSEAAE